MQRFNVTNPELGFTLVELLVATLMSAFVIAAAGGGLVTILQLNKDEEAKIQRQIELNRAIDYLTEEVRMSSKVEPDGNNLKLSVPSGSSTITITYSTASSSAAGSIWMKDFVVNRKVDTDPNAVLVDALIASSDSSTENCPTTMKGVNGFYFCIHDDRKVDLYLYGKTGPKNTDYVKVKTTAFARAK